MARFQDGVVTIPTLTRLESKKLTRHDRDGGIGSASKLACRTMLPQS